METASLRIRFTPLMKTLKNNTKCCVEIVPEVSCVENLDKISWKAEKDSIEYTVPVTYKIILKKREIEKKESVNLVILEKTYHSCVDLLPPSSMTSIDFASGDMNRILSDSYIMRQIIVENDKNVLKNYPVNVLNAHVTESEQKHLQIGVSAIDQKNKEAKVLVGDNRTDNKDNNVPTDSYKLDISDNQFSNKIKNTEKDLKLSTVTATQSVETITEISTRNQDDSKRKLSLSPLCSVNTNDNPFPEAIPNIPLKSIVYDIFQFEKKDCNTYPSIRFPMNEINFEDTRNTKENMFQITSHRRVLPEARVAKFIKIMENEIMPLKRMLNDILLKCSGLGLVKNKFFENKLIFYQTVPMCRQEVGKYCKIEKQSISNRAVYSIVFEG